MQADLVELAQKQSEVYSVFGNASRVLVLWALGKRELSVSDIALAIGCSLQNTSQHLRLMRDKGILVSRRDGNAVYYRINDQGPLASCGLLPQIRERTLIKK